MPLVPMAVAMMVGIAAGHLVPTLPSWLWIAALVVPLLAAAVLLYMGKETPASLYSALLMASFLSLGGLLCQSVDPLHDAGHWTRLAETDSGPSRPHHLAVRLKETPSPHQRSWRTAVEVVSFDQQTCRGETLLFLRNDNSVRQLRIGDELLLHIYVDSSRHTLYATGDHYIVSHRDSVSLRARSEAMRMRLLRRMQNGPMQPRYRGVAEALTLGWRGDLETTMQAQFRDAGIMHLLCVSGLHVGVLAALVGGLLVWLGNERRGRIVRGSVQLLVLWGFALLTGLAPATVRAALMFSLLVVSRMMGRRTDSLNILAAAAIAMLTAKPILLFDVGWQLSFSAVAGILTARPAIALFRSKLWKAAIVSLAATVATLPITLATFHQIQPYFLIANILIVPLAAVLLFTSLLYMALPCPITAWPPNQLFRCCDALTSGISHLPHATISGLHPVPWVIALTTLATIFILVTINMTLSRHRDTKSGTPC